MLTAFELIVTQWDVNTLVLSVLSKSRSELIVTQWDVNSVVIAMACQESGELIVTQWDVNYKNSINA